MPSVSAVRGVDHDEVVGAGEDLGQLGHASGARSGRRRPLSGRCRSARAARRPAGRRAGRPRRRACRAPAAAGRSRGRSGRSRRSWRWRRRRAAASGRGTGRRRRATAGSRRTASSSGWWCASPSRAITVNSAIGTGATPPSVVTSTSVSHQRVAATCSAPEVSSCIQRRRGAWSGAGRTAPVCSTSTSAHSRSSISSGDVTTRWWTSTPGARWRRSSSHASSNGSVVR